MTGPRNEVSRRYQIGVKELFAWSVKFFLSPLHIIQF